MQHPGRPQSGSLDARQALIEAAKRCFTENDYHKVTTRMLASEAKVSAALIRYYFINKEGLYKEMISAVTGEVMAQVQQQRAQSDHASLENIIRGFYAVIRQHPEFPLLMLKEVALNQGICRDYILNTLEADRGPFMKSLIQEFLNHPNVRQDIDPTLLRLQLMGTILFPWTMRHAAPDIENIEFNGEVVDAYMEQAIAILVQGCQRPRKYSSDSHGAKNEN